MGKGRAPCCDKNIVKKGPWSPEEDLRLIKFVQKHGHGNWRSLPKQAGLLRCGKSCRLRWINYLRPDLKRGNVTKEEEETIIMLHQSFGNKWSKIATYLPGRTDNEIKNVWNTHLKKRLIKKEGDGNHHKEEIKSLSKSSSFSLSSSSSSTSLISPNDNQNIVEALESSTPKMAQELLNVEVLEKKTGNDEVKEYSSSSNSSYATNNCSNSSLNDTDCMPIDDMDFWINAEYGKNFEPSLSQDQDIEIFPLQIDGGFWEMLDDLDPMILKELEISQTNFGEEHGRNFEVGKWMKNLENELGLEATSEGQNVTQND